MAHRFISNCSRHRLQALLLSAAGLMVLAGGNCFVLPNVPGGGDPVFNNTTDKSNNSASYLTSSACAACHPDIGAWQNVHGHAHKLNRVQGGPPIYPPEGVRAGVPTPPDGFTWNDVSYVIGGYNKKGRFIDNDGFILTTGLTGKKTQWNLDLPALGRSPEFVNYESSATTPKPYAFSCFECHTTGPMEQDASAPMFQENRPGFMGTWVEAGIQCESCHGPGSNHVPNPEARDIYVDATGAQTCFQCHNRPFDSQTGEILASGGYIQHHEQWPELRASGGHADFACTVCHDPHRSVLYDRANAIRQTCTDCHPDRTMGFHDGKVFVRGDYVEPLTCESCHMPFATKSAASADPAVVGALGRMGDTRTHIFRISTDPVDFNSFFTTDGKQVVRDAQGRAAVTVDFACLRCHNEVTLPTLAFSVERAAEISLGIHLFP